MDSYSIVFIGCPVWWHTAPMIISTLGLSGLRVSALGLGRMGMSHGYGLPADRREMSRLLADAVDTMPMSEVFGGSKILTPQK